MSYAVTIVVAVVSFVISAAFGLILIPYLKKLKAGAHILEIGPAWQKSKEGTPLMGGFMFILSTVIATVIGCLILKERSDCINLIVSMVTCLLFMAIGFVDDYIKVVKKRNQGFNIKAKSICQAFVVVAYLLAYRFLLGGDEMIFFPWIGNVNFGIFYYIIMAVAIYFVVNSVNFTDGVDGLCGSVTVVYSAAFVIIFGILRYAEMGVFSTALAGGVLGFLVWNLHPAKVFMGDTGSMFLGGAVVVMGMEAGLELLIPLVGIIYIIEGLSDVIQIASFKIRKKRVFKMAPIHHHFEMSGWSEYKIVIIFSLVTFIGGILGILYANHFANSVIR